MLRDANHVGHLRIRELLDIAQPHCLPERCRKGIKRGLQIRVEGVAEQDPLGRVEHLGTARL